MKKSSVNFFLISLVLVLFIGCGNQKGDYEYNKAIKAKKSGDLARSRSLLEKSLRKTVSPEKQAVIANELGLILWDLKQYKEAHNFFKDALEKSSDFNPSALNYAISLFHEGKIDEAEIIVNNLLTENPNQINALALMGCIKIQQKEWDLAHKKINVALEKDPSNPVLKNIWVITKLQIDKNLDQTGWDLEQLVELHPEYLPARYNLAILYEKWLNDSESAKIHYSYYINHESSDELKLELSEQAIKRLESTIAENLSYSSDPIAAKLMEQKGTEAYKNKNYNNAINYFRNALEQEPKRISAHYNIGLCYYEMNNFNTASDSFKNALKINKNYENARYMLSVSYYQLRDYAQAEREAKRLYSINESRAKVLLGYIESAKNR